MLLDIGSVFAGIGLAIVAFIVVIVVCAVILALLAAILPSYEGRTTARAAREGRGGKGCGGGDASGSDAYPADPDAADTVTPWRARIRPPRLTARATRLPEPRVLRTAPLTV